MLTSLYSSIRFYKNAEAVPVAQTCTFRVDYTLENIPGREFGSVFIGPSNANVALSVVSEGWAKVGKSHPQKKSSTALHQLTQSKFLASPSLWLCRSEKAPGRKVHTLISCRLLLRLLKHRKRVSGVRYSPAVKSRCIMQYSSRRPISRRRPAD